MSLVVRRRRPSDLPGLAGLLLAQQPTSRYPFRDPLPVPVERFLRADDAEAAWTAEADGRAVGHVCRVGPPAGFPGAEEMNAACAAAHGCPVERLAWIAAFFVGLGARGAGVGRVLLETAVADARAAGLHPCLEVLPVHPAALGLYESTGWREVLRVRPGWLREAAGDEGPDVRVMVLPAGRPVPRALPVTAPRGRSTGDPAHPRARAAPGG